MTDKISPTYTWHKNQNIREEQVFKSFASICPLNIKLFIKKKPPEPDIYCSLTDGTSLYFELGEIIDEKKAKNIKLTPKWKQECKKKLGALPKATKEKIEEYYRNNIIYAAFEDKNINLEKEAIKVIKFLINQACLPPGKYKAEDHPLLSPNIRFIEIGILSSPGIGPYFGSSLSGGFYTEPIEELIKKKFESSYDTHGLELHLLAYFDFETPLYVPLKVKEFIKSEITQSQFTKVWIYYFSNNKILLSFPE